MTQLSVPLYTLRVRCCVCEHQNTFQRLSLLARPLYMGVTSNPPSDDTFIPEEVVICNKCGTVQLNGLVNLSLLYNQSHQPGVTGETWSRHHQSFAEFIVSGCGNRIVEIGAGSMTLAKLILAKKSVSYTVVDPQAIPQENIKVIPEFFNTFTEIGSPDTIVHSHTLEHFYEPAHILRTMNRKLPLGGTMFISVPDIQAALELGHHNALNFEHVYMTSHNSLEYLFRAAGFSVVTMNRFNATNIFYKLVKVNTGQFFAQTSPLPADYDRNKDIYFNYLAKSRLDMAQVCQVAVQSNAPVFLFGAHVFSQRMLEFGLDAISTIRGVLDNNPEKQNKRLYGTSLTTFSPSVLNDFPDALVVVRAGQYSGEISDGLKQKYPKIGII